MSLIRNVVASAILIAAAQTVSADLVNTDFETGDLTGWTTVTNGFANPVQVGLGDTVTDAGTIPGSLTGDHYGYTSQIDPGSSFLIQTFTVQPGVNRIFFDLFVLNAAGDFVVPDPASLDFAGAANQQARVDIILQGAAIDTVDPADIIVAAFQTQPGDPLTQPWDTFELDVTSALEPYVGQEVVFRFAQVDNLGFFNFGIDNVNVGVSQVPSPAGPSTAIPTLSEWGMILLSSLLALFAVSAMRRRQA